MLAELVVVGVDKHWEACLASVAFVGPLEEPSSVDRVLADLLRLVDVEGALLRAPLEAFQVGWAMAVDVRWVNQSFA